METFPYNAEYGGSLEPEIRVLSAEFGDGYKQTVADGLQNVRNIYTLPFIFKNDEYMDALDFIERHKAVIPFLWEDKLRRKTSVYICRRWTINYGAYDYITLNLTFEEVLDEES